MRHTRHMTELSVFVHQEQAGAIRRQPDGDIIFRYDEQYLHNPSATPLSVSMPLTDSDYDTGAWIDGLLPDNRQTRKNLAEKYGAPGSHPAALLATPLGRDCAGAVQFFPAEPDDAPPPSTEIRHVSEKEIEQWIKEVKSDWTAGSAPGSGRQSCVAGEQAKCALHFSDGQWGHPQGSIPTTHILKPGLEWHQNADVVEHLCLNAASRLGVDVAESAIVHFRSERALAVERFDRIRTAQGAGRLHQEDLCQAFGIAAADKYQSEGGPRPQDIVTLLRQEAADPDADIGRFMDALMFNFALGASDGHAKNYSIMLEAGDIKLAPLYDIISFFPYKGDMPYRKLRTAMKVGGDYTLRAGTYLSSWEKLAENLGIDTDATITGLGIMLHNAPDAIAGATRTLGHSEQALPEVKNLQKHITQWTRQASTDLGLTRSATSVANRTAKAPQSAPRPSPPHPVRCGAAIKGNRRCKRMLRNEVCPDHKDSIGSREIRNRATKRR